MIVEDTWKRVSRAGQTQRFVRILLRNPLGERIIGDVTRSECQYDSRWPLLVPLLRALWPSRCVGSNACERRRPWSTPIYPDSTVNDPGGDAYVSKSSDELLLVLSESQSGAHGGLGSGDLWITARAAHVGPWETRVNLGPLVNTAYWDVSADIAYDGSVLWYTSGRADGRGAIDLWQAPILPITDFGGDGRIDGKGMASGSFFAGLIDEVRIYNRAVRPEAHQ